MFRKFTLLLMTGMVLSLQCQALPSDRKQPIQIESDNAEHSERLGKTVYTGGVVITQGTIQIKADQVTLINQGKKVARIICVGNPAYYQQQPAAENGLIIARASTIEYSVEKDQVSLIKNASLEQNGSTISGELIEYDLSRELVKAHGNLTGKQRIHMVIPSSALQRIQAGQTDKDSINTESREQKAAGQNSDQQKDKIRTTGNSEEGGQR